MSLVTLRLLGIARRDKVLGWGGESVRLVATIGQYSTIKKRKHAPVPEHGGMARIATITTK